MPDMLPVIIVGGGPVGLALSLELSKLGVRHLLVCDASGPSTHPKCNTSNARSMEHFRRLGIAPRVRFGGLPADYPTDIVYLTRLGGAEIARVRFPSPRQAAAQGGGAWQTPEPQHRISQIFLERILIDAARAEPSATIRFSTCARDFTERADRIEVEVEDLATGRLETHAARWLVGCDGGRSSVRRHFGIGYTGTSAAERSIFGGTMIATYFRSAELQAMLKGREGFMYWTLNPELRSVTVAIDGADHFLTHVQVPDGVAAETMDPRAFLPTIAGRPLAFEICSSAVWNAGFCLVAETFRKGRAFLAGDAAHLFTPTGGFGMNTGIDDTANLAWKLAAVEQGWGGTVLLDSYDAERRPVAFRNTAAASDIADVIAQFEVPEAIEDGGDAGAQARAWVADAIHAVATEEFQTVGVQLGVRYEGSPIIAADGTPPPPDLRTRYEPTARPGSRLPHFADAQGTSIYDRLARGGFALLAADVDAGRAIAAAEVRSIPLVVVPVDPSSAVLLGARLVLVRPDQHVAWRGDDLPEDVDQLLAIVSGKGSLPWTPAKSSMPAIA